MGLSKANRLRRRRDFQNVYQQGNRRQSSHIIILALAVSEPIIQIGISISQKVSKKAVIRNRLKRQIKAIFRQYLDTMSTGWQIVIILKPNAAECQYEHFLRELKELLTKVGIIKNGY